MEDNTLFDEENPASAHKEPLDIELAPYLEARSDLNIVATSAFGSFVRTTESSIPLATIESNDKLLKEKFIQWKAQSNTIRRRYVEQSKVEMDTKYQAYKKYDGRINKKKEKIMKKRWKKEEKEEICRFQPDDMTSELFWYLKEKFQNHIAQIPNFNYEDEYEDLKEKWECEFKNLPCFKTKPYVEMATLYKDFLQLHPQSFVSTTTQTTNSVRSTTDLSSVATNSFMSTLVEDETLTYIKESPDFKILRGDPIGTPICWCRKPLSKNEGFIIQCSNCKEFYHGNCVIVSRTLSLVWQTQQRFWICKTCTNHTPEHLKENFKQGRVKICDHRREEEEEGKKEHLKVLLESHQYMEAAKMVANTPFLRTKEMMSIFLQAPNGESEKSVLEYFFQLLETQNFL